MLKMRIQLVFTVFCVFLWLSGCKTEDASGPFPSVVIAIPIDNQAYKYLDTIFIKAEISHPQAIDFVRVSLIDKESSPVLPVLNFYPDDHVFTLETSIVLDNLLLESGQYSIQVKASADGEISNEWAAINYTSVPRKPESLIVLTKGPGSSCRIMDVSSGNQITERFTYTGDFSGSAVCSRYQLFFTAGAVSSGLNAWDLTNNKLRWNIPAVSSPPLPYFTSIYSNNDEVYVSTRDAYISGYSESGMSTFRSKQFSNGYFIASTRYKLWLTAVFEPFNSVLNELIIFNYPGGTVFNRLQFEGDMVSFAGYLPDEILIFINNGSTSAAYSYSFEQNMLLKLKDFPQGRILRVSMPDSQNAFLAMEDGVYWYRPQIASIVKVLTKEGISDLIYDDISGKLFVATGKQVEVFDFPTMQITDIYNFTDEIVNIHLRFNK